MKNKRTSWLIALVAIIGFIAAGTLTLAGCDWLLGEAEPDDPDNPGNLEPGDFTSPTGIEMVWIKDGTFWMGSPEDEPGRTDSDTVYNGTGYVGSGDHTISPERRHIVVLTRGFYMGKYPVTQGQWKAVMGETLSPGNYPYLGDNHPRNYVTWNEAAAFCNRLSVMEGLTPAYRMNGSTDPSDWGDDSGYWDPVLYDANGYRLPDEEQWEWACRAGTSTAYYTGAEFSDDIGWYEGNSGMDWFDNTTFGKLPEVGKKPPNPWGLYDMAGNVKEWCEGDYGSYPTYPVTEGTAYSIVNPVLYYRQPDRVICRNESVRAWGD